MKKITFKDIAKSLGMEEAPAIVSLSTPVCDEEVLQYRAFCIGELLISRLLKSGVKTRSSWGEIKHSYLNSEQVVCLVQFNNVNELFMLELPLRALSGHKDSVVHQIRKLDKELPVRVERWFKQLLSKTVC